MTLANSLSANSKISDNGGMSRIGKTCVAVSGAALLAIGLLSGIEVGLFCWLAGIGTMSYLVGYETGR